MIHQLVVGDTAAVTEIVDRAQTSDDVTTLVAAALFSPSSRALMARAATLARTSRDRQLVAIADAHLHGDLDRVLDLARDHLADNPDSVLVAWISAASARITPTRKDLP